LNTAFVQTCHEESEEGHLTSEPDHRGQDHDESEGDAEEGQSQPGNEQVSALRGHTYSKNNVMAECADMPH
jgi:hypothetical protein